MMREPRLAVGMLVVVLAVVAFVVGPASEAEGHAGVSGRSAAEAFKGTTFNGVSCSSARACTAVGRGRVAGRWDGSRWSAQPLATRSGQGRRLTAVSCASGRSCTAVGYSMIKTGRHRTVQPLAENWNGSSWSVDPAPVPGRSIGEARLLAVACPVRNSCEAVGYYLGSRWPARLCRPCAGGNNSHALAEHWDGMRWSIENVVDFNASRGLQGVSCPDATSCIAVGWGITERWNGHRWFLLTRRRGGHALSCSSPRHCTAMGSSSISRWNGKRWSVQSKIVADGNLRGVSCPSHRFCTAVGDRSRTAGFPRPQIAQWNGASWTYNEHLGQPSFFRAWFAGVSCNSSDACVAVGGTEGRAAIAARWDGTRWAYIVPRPEAGIAQR